MDESPRVFAIVPAAGHSQRMGRDKQLIEINGKPMLRAVVDTLIAAGVARVMVVTRRAIVEAMGMPHVNRAHVAYNEDASSEMIDSVRIGLKESLMRFGNEPTDGILVCPADHPGLSVADVRACLDAFRETPNQIVIASHEGKRGHPMIFPVALTEFVRSSTCDSGLNAMANSHYERVLTVPCSSRGVTHDVDTPNELGESHGAFDP